MSQASARTISELHAALDAKRFSLREWASQSLARAKASPHNAFLSYCDERVLAQADQGDALIAKNGGKVPREKLPLLGVTLGVKDVLAVRGTRTTCASKMLENYVAPYTATAVARLEAAGAMSLGKLNMDEFAMGGSNENSAFGPVKHPRFPDRVPGGSSGGSATVVGAGLCLSALGTDTGGSIRLPASYCGVVGLKPTYGRVSRYGMVAFASSLDQIGPLASSVEDVAAHLDVMSGPDGMDPTSIPDAPAESFARAARQDVDWSGVRVGVPREYFVDGVEADVARSVREALAWMEKRGAKLVDLSLPYTPYVVSVYYMVAVSEASSNLSRFDSIRFGSRPPSTESARDLADFYRLARSQFGPEVKRRILLGTFALSAGYHDAYYRRACQVRRLIQQDFARAFKQVDVVAGPVCPTTAFKIGEKSQDPLLMYLNDIFTIPANLAGLPALSVPCGESAAGLPIGLQLAAAPMAEARLLSIAGSFERGRSGQGVTA